jgi:hypothetical protein
MQHMKDPAAGIPPQLVRKSLLYHCAALTEM